MAEPLVSRQTLRRDIAKTARMHFPLRYPDGYLGFSQGGDSNSGTNDTEVFYCTSLKQSEGFWNDAYIYVISTDSAVDGFERQIPNFNADKSALFLEWPCTTDQVPTSDDQFELLDVWPPHQIHDFINDAIRDSWREFPEIVEDQTLIIEEDVRRYDLTGLSKSPAYLLKIFMERSETSMMGQLSTVTDSDVFGDTTMDLSDIVGGTSSDWAASIYYGTGTGQLFEIASADTTTQLFTVETSATSTPDTTSKIRVWEKNRENRSWYPLLAARLDRMEHPSYFDIIGDPFAYYGYRLRLSYVRQPAILTADTDETTVPQYFVKNKALAFMQDALVGDNRASRTDHVAIAEHFDRLARDYALRNPRRIPAGTIWEVEGGIDAGYGIQVNPLDW